MRRILMIGSALAASAVGLAACGQKGPLIHPTDAAAAGRATLTQSLQPDLPLPGLLAPAQDFPAPPAAAASAPAR